LTKGLNDISRLNVYKRLNTWIHRPG